MNAGFTSIDAQNYKSFKHLHLDMQLNGHPKSMVAIYGENGAGKSNIVNLFSSLRLSIRTLRNKLNFLDISSKGVTSRNNNVNKFAPLKDPRIYNMLLGLRGIIEHDNIQGCFPYYSKMMDTKRPMIVTYNFKINNKPGYYKLEFVQNRRKDSLELISEKLNFTINRGIGTIFYIQNDGQKIKLNPSIFHTALLRKSIKDSLKKYWGEHTFLASFYYVLKENKSKFTTENISPNFWRVYSYFKKISFKTDSMSAYVSNKSTNILHNNLVQGICNNNNNNINAIKNTEEALNDYFRPLYSNLVKIKYMKNRIMNNKIHYELIEYKNMGGNIRIIPFRLESHGTIRLLSLFALLLNAIEGNTVVIDEIDQGIHDLLMNRLINDLKSHIKGQLIFTTHDTALMTELPPVSLYVIQVDPFGNKRVIPISRALKDRSKYIEPNNNVEHMYKNGFFSGIPYLREISFNKILNDVKRGGTQK